MNKPRFARCADCGELTDGECLSYKSTDGETVTWNCGCVSGIDSQGIIQTAPLEPRPSAQVHPIFQPIFDAMFRRVR